MMGNSMSREDALYAIAAVAYEATCAWGRMNEGETAVLWDDVPTASKKLVIDLIQLIVDDPRSGPEDFHQKWLDIRVPQGWCWGPEECEEELTHPHMMPYEFLPASYRMAQDILYGVVRSMAQG